MRGNGDSEKTSMGIPDSCRGSGTEPGSECKALWYKSLCSLKPVSFHDVKGEAQRSEVTGLGHTEIGRPVHNQDEGLLTPRPLSFPGAAQRVCVGTGITVNF